MNVLYVTIILFAMLLFLLSLGLPVAFTLGGLSLIFILIEFGPNGLFMLPATAWEAWTDSILITIPLFVLMAQFLSNSGVADDIYEAMHKWMGTLRGGLAMGTVLICTVFAAMSGVSAVGTVTMGLVALPAMLKRNYNKNIAVGAISAGGTLGILIPPSVPMILYGYLAKESVGKLFMAGIIPGMVISLIFISYIAVKCYFKPEMGPPISDTEKVDLKEKMASLKAVILPLVLIVIVLGFIYMGITTPTEAAGIGAFGAFICVLIYRRFSWKVLRSSLIETLRVTAMCGWIILGAKLFTHVYTAMGASDMVQGFILGHGMNKWTVLIMTQLILLVLGMFMDPIGIMMICVPIFVPIMKSFDFNIVWFGVLFTINLEMSYITPPFGVNLFYMKSIVPKYITMLDIYKAIIPFVVLEAIALVVIILFPQLSLWLPYR